MTNLLTNASKFSPAGTTIHVSVRRDSSSVQLCVRDAGIGLTDTQREHIFELFAQVDHSLARAEGGLGIGLTLVRQLVEMHGGHVEARSAGLGRGSEFIVTLPLATSAAEPGADEFPPVDLPPQRVLVVDDNVDSAQSLAAALAQRGHSVQTAYGGAGALLSVERESPHVVLLDVGMPGMNGLEACRRLRAAGYAGVVVAVTGWGQPQDRELTAAAGFDAAGKRRQYAPI